MFDRVDRSHRDGDHIINVKQQPNDSADAARLYGECMEKARDEVKGALIAQYGAYNELTVVRLEPVRSLETDKLTVRLLFKLNGHTYEFDVVDVDKIADEAMTVVAQHLVSQILNKIFRSGKRPSV